MSTADSVLENISILLSQCLKMMFLLSCSWHLLFEVRCSQNEAGVKLYTVLLIAMFSKNRWIIHQAGLTAYTGRRKQRRGRKKKGKISKQIKPKESVVYIYIYIYILFLIISLFLSLSVQYKTCKDGSVLGVTVMRIAMLTHCQALTQSCSYTEGIQKHLIILRVIFQYFSEQHWHNLTVRLYLL